MLALRWCWLLGIFCLWMSAATAAELNPPDALQGGALRAWHALLHADEGGQSTIDSPEFFFSPDGKRDVQSEWQASFAAMNGSQDSAQTARCRFPARWQFMRQHVAELNDKPESPCVDFSAWKNKLDTQSVTLVFADAYLGNPSSMFGHTFLRLDTDGSPLLAWVVNFAAQTRDAKSISFAWKGLTGGYFGRFGLARYYDKVTEYVRLEQRSLWEYRLRLSRSDLDFLLAHLWEMRGINFDYYFFDENCSYQLLALLQVLRPELPISDGFDLFAAPIDTVRRLQQFDLLEPVQYRPSLQRSLANQIEQLSPQTQDALAGSLHSRRVVDEDLPSDQRAALLDVLPGMARYHASQSKFVDSSDQAAWQELQKQALQQRSDLPLPSQLLAPAAPAAPDRAHLSQRFQLAHTHHQTGPDAWLIGWRPVLHEALDGNLGMPPGSEISVVDLRVVLQDSNWQLQRGQIIEVRALPLRDRWFKPWSWTLGVGYARDEGVLNATGYGRAEGGVGMSWALSGMAMRASLLGRSALLLGKAGQRGLESGVELRLHGQWNADWPWQLRGYAWQRAGVLEESAAGHQLVEFSQHWQINPKWGLRLGVQADSGRTESNSQTSAQLGAYRYF